MSWFKLNVNDSLNSLKGQISNVSNVVHDVFTEGILDDPNANDDATGMDEVEMMEAANRKIEELGSMCTARDSEVRCGHRLHRSLE